MLFSMKTTFFFFYISLAISTSVMQLYLEKKGLDDRQLRTVFWPRIGAQLIGGIAFGLIVDSAGQYLLIFSIQVVSSTIILLPMPWVEEFGAIDADSGAANAMNNSPILAHSCDAISKLSQATYQNLLSDSECCSRHSLIEDTNTTFELMAWNKSFEDVEYHVFEEIYCQWHSVFVDCKKCSSLNLESPGAVLVVNVSSRLPCQCKDKLRRSKFDLWILHKFGAKGHASESNFENLQPPLQSKDEYYYFLLIMSILLSLSGFFDGGITSLIDSFVVEKSKLEDDSIDYGKQRVWGAIGGGLSAVCIRLYVTGSSNQEHIRFTFAFAFFVISNFIFYLSCFHMVRGTKFRRSRSTRDNTSLPVLFLKVFKNHSVIFYLSTVLLVGIANAVKNKISFHIIRDTGASDSLYDTLILISSAFDAAAFPFARRLISLIGGNYRVITLAMIANALRFLIYSYLNNAKHLIFMEPFRCVCFSLAWVAAIYEIDDLAPEGLSVTMIALLHGIYFGLSSALSDVLFDYLYKSYGLVFSVRGLSSAFILWTLIMIIYRNICTKCRRSLYTPIQRQNRPQGTQEVVLLDRKSPQTTSDDYNKYQSLPETWI